MPRKKKTADLVILKMILEVITKIGATEFSLEDLSKKTGLSPATLLQRFGSKKNILYKALELANQELKDNFANRSLVNNSPLQEIMGIYLEFSSSTLTPKDVAGGLDILKLDITEKKLNAITRKYFETRRKKIAALVVLAQEKGEIPEDVDATDLVWNLESLWQGSIMLWALIGDGKLHDWLKKRFTTFLKVQI